jgi:NADH-quinone oxidoreductase subunit J
MMLVVFVIMVLNKAKDHDVPRFDWLSLAGMGTAVALAALLVTRIQVPGNVPAAGTPRAEVGVIAPELFDLTAAGPGYYILFELIGILLLVAIVAAVLLAKRELDAPAPAAPAAKDDHGTH